jgi:outer membrane protein
VKSETLRELTGMVAVLTSLLVASPAGAQNSDPPPLATSPAPGALTLGEAVREALHRRPLLATDEARMAAARARITQAHAALLPRVDFQGSVTDGPLGAPPLGLGGVVGTPIKKHAGASVNLIQTFLDFGRALNTVRARRQEATASAEALRADENRTALDVQQAYFQALQARRLLGVNQQILEQRRLVARQAEIFRQNGLATRVDVDLAELAVSQAQLAVVRSQNDIETAYAALGAAVGRPVPPDTPLEDIAPAPTPPPAPAGAQPPTTPAPVPPPPGAIPSLEEATAAALRQRPELAQAEAQARAFDRLAEAARAGGRPLLTGVASVGKVIPTPISAATDKPYAVGMAVTVPIFTGGLVAGQVEEARRNAAAARANGSELANQVRQQVTSAIANLAASEENLRVAKAQMVRAQDLLSLSTQRYQAQLGNIIELTQAQVGYATAQNDYVRALYDREVARAALDFAVGRQFEPGVRR